MLSHVGQVRGRVSGSDTVDKGSYNHGEKKDSVSAVSQRWENIREEAASKAWFTCNEFTCKNKFNHFFKEDGVFFGLFLIWTILKSSLNLLTISFVFYIFVFLTTSHV